MDDASIFHCNKTSIQNSLTDNRTINTMMLGYFVVFLSSSILLFSFLLCILISLKINGFFDDKAAFITLITIIGIKSVFYTAICYLKEDYVRNLFKYSNLYHFSNNENIDITSGYSTPISPTSINSIVSLNPTQIIGLKSFYLTPVHVILLESTALLLLFFLFTFICKNNNCLKNYLIVFSYLGMIINGLIFLYEDKIHIDLSVIFWFNVMLNVFFSGVFCPYEKLRRIMKDFVDCTSFFQKKNKKKC